jgi:hypothetical protein
LSWREEGWVLRRHELGEEECTHPRANVSLGVEKGMGSGEDGEGEVDVVSDEGAGLVEKSRGEIGSRGETGSESEAFARGEVDSIGEVGEIEGAEDVCLASGIDGSGKMGS